MDLERRLRRPTTIPQFNLIPLFAHMILGSLSAITFTKGYLFPVKQNLMNRKTYGTKPLKRASNDFVSAIDARCAFSPDPNLVIGTQGYGPLESDTFELCAEFCESLGPQCAYIELTDQIGHQTICTAYVTVMGEG